MKEIKLLIACLLLALPAKSQKGSANDFSSIDATALKLPDSLTNSTGDISRYVVLNFRTDKEKARAIFIWIANNIQYDIANMFALNFYESKEEKISKSLRSRKGICENYAALFNDICLKSGIKSFVIEGYTKQNGFAEYLPHAWCAALIDSSWLLFDPTWGSGYITKGKFVKKINNEYFQALPSSLINTHIPFDYLWQFLNYPITNQEFYESKTSQNKSRSYFNFIDSIQIYESQNRLEQLISSSYRIEANGARNSLIFDRLHRIKLDIENAKLEIENERRSKNIDLYNAAVAFYNDAINNFNIFLQYRNTQFKPVQSDQEIQKMVDTVYSILKEVNIKINQINNPDKNTEMLITQLNKSVTVLSGYVKEQQDWLTEYFSRSKTKRNSKFYEKKKSVLHSTN